MWASRTSSAQYSASRISRDDPGAEVGGRRDSWCGRDQTRGIQARHARPNGPGSTAAGEAAVGEPFYVFCERNELKLDLGTSAMRRTAACG